MMKTINVMKYSAYLLASVSMFSTLALTNLSFASHDQEDIQQTRRIVAQQNTDFECSLIEDQLKDLCNSPEYKEYSMLLEEKKGLVEALSNHEVRLKQFPDNNNLQAQYEGALKNVHAVEVDLAKLAAISEEYTNLMQKKHMLENPFMSVNPEMSQKPILQNKSLVTDIASLGCGSVSLPRDVVTEITSHITLNDLVAFSHVSKATHAAARNEYKNRVQALQKLAASTPEVQEALDYFNVSAHPNNLIEMKTVMGTRSLEDSQEVLNQAKMYFNEAYYAEKMRIENISSESIYYEIKDNKSLYLLPSNIGKLSLLGVLDLSSNNLVYVHKNIGKLENLSMLRIDDNKLQSLPPEIGNLNALTFLNLSNNKLQFLPSGFEGVKNLNILYLNNNKLQTIPSEIGKLKALKELALGKNELHSLPSEIGELKALKELSLNDNKLHSLPSEIGKLTTLRTLSLQNNILQFLPSEIGKLTTLHTLRLYNNMLQFLPTEMIKLKALEHLILRPNPLDTEMNKLLTVFFPNTKITGIN